LVVGRAWVSGWRLLQGGVFRWVNIFWSWRGPDGGGPAGRLAGRMLGVTAL